jgi:hypothetical protein
MLRYQRKNKISEPKLAEKLGISENKLIDILFAKIHKLELAELLTYFDNSGISLEIKVTI